MAPEQKNGAQSRVDVRGRDDVDVVEAPRSAVGYVAGYRGRSLREIERETCTFIFVNDTDTGGGGADAEIAEILVCGERAERRERAVRIVRERVEYSLRNPPPDRDRGRRRSRSPDAPRREREGGGGGVRAAARGGIITAGRRATNVGAAAEARSPRGKARERPRAVPPVRPRRRARSAVRGVPGLPQGAVSPRPVPVRARRRRGTMRRRATDAKPIRSSSSNPPERTTPLPAPRCVTAPCARPLSLLPPLSAVSPW